MLMAFRDILKILQHITSMQLASMGELGEKGDGKEKARNNDEVKRKLIWLNLLLKFIKCYSVNITKERDSPAPCNRNYF